LSHRGIVHSLAAAPIEVVAVATVTWTIGRFMRNGGSSWRRLALMASVGLVVHLLLDLSNQYGVRILLPFDARWHAWDLTDMFDFWILAILAVGWFVPLVAHLHGLEPNRVLRLGRLTAIASLALVASYLGALLLCHHLALDSLALHDPSSRPTRIACLPGSISPLRWTGVRETARGVEIHEVRVPAGVLWQRQVFPKDGNARVEQAVRRHPQVRALLSFARFPIFRTEPWARARGPAGYAVIVEDAGWVAARGYVGGPCVRLWLDADFHVVHENAVAWR
jgi:inner membrane protein